MTWNEIEIDWEVIDLTQEQIEELTNLAWQNIRKKRDSLLQQVDGKVLRYQSEVRIGVTTTTDNISDLDTYAQALRDVPSTFSDPGNVVWPTYPD